MNIGDMYFNKRAAHIFQTIPQRIPVVSQCAWVDDHPPRLWSMGLEKIDDCPFMIGLKIQDLDPVGLAHLADALDHVRQTILSVYLGLTLAKTVEVGAVHKQYGVRHSDHLAFHGKLLSRAPGAHKAKIGYIVP